jgi:S-adenosylmethionine:tRNA ribosyltransferase-isomerase
MNQTGGILYKCLIGGVSKWKRGTILEKKIGYQGEELTLSVSIAERRADCFVVQLNWTPENLSFAAVLHEAGKIPIPPYLHREADEQDEVRYQTIYAKADGSVAAPTAGLHFTPELLAELMLKGVHTAFTTLHVGAGTFMPVKSQTMQGHEMHAEYIEIDGELLDALLGAETVIPVGTTAMRTLESLYWMGVKVIQQPCISLPALEINQWEVYDQFERLRVPKEEALLALKHWMNQSGHRKLILRTRILIAPGYHFGLCSGLITNFHQPKSTLLLLVAAMVGQDWKKIYNYALENDFRFLSYGDGSLLLPPAMTNS